MTSTMSEGGAVFVLGGARSGKSRFAEDLVLQSGRKKIYLATSEIWDEEMEDRVEQHKARRGPDWKVMEEPLEISSVLKKHADRDTCILVDCLTLWLTNLMMAERNIKEAGNELIETIRGLSAESSIVFVSNEVGQGIVPIDKMAREFRDHAGHLHQDIAQAVSHVWFVTAGLPQKLK